MITILHGDDTAASRKEYGEIRKKYPHGIIFDGDTVTITDLTQELQGGGLFSEEKYVFIEQLFTKKKSPLEKEAFSKLLAAHESDAIITLWEGREVDKKILGAFPTIQNKLFKLPQTLFSLLDSLKPKNTKQLVELFHKTEEATEVELIFFMLVRQIRLLLAFSERGTIIEETKRIASWQQGKLQKQASLFTKNELITHHKKLFEIEKNMKVGNLSMSLSSTIDIFLAEV